MAGDSETLFEAESGKVFTLAKELDPRVRTVAGGVHFAHAARHAFAHYPLDAIVIGEGEETTGDLLDAWQRGDDLATVQGLALPGPDGEVRRTPPRPLIANLDDLPFPAFDLAPMELYGTARYLFSPGGVTIHHSRGCVSQCSFCACWLQMAERDDDPSGLPQAARWRTRSPESVIAEVDVLQGRYRRDCLVFVDDTFNVDPAFSGEFCERLLRRPRPITWFAFFRYDYLVRDEREGLFALMMRSGLRHICIGLERGENDELTNLGKRHYDLAQAIEFLPALRRKHPELFLQTTFIIGTPDESRESLARLGRYIEALAPDYPALHPVTPVPGTRVYEDALREGRLEITDFQRYDWMTPVMSTKHLSRAELEQLLFEMNRAWMKPWRILRNVFSRRAYRRRMYLWWLLVTLRIGIDYLAHLVAPRRSIVGRAALSDFVGMVKPPWYDA
jgi:anaerobic magnesium-protoporphyrin IX monomethyl ester cyclase